ncbi:MAG: DNA repair protein RadC [Cyanobacteria bacterium P01_F01_bin.150]
MFGRSPQSFPADYNAIFESTCTFPTLSELRSSEGIYNALTTPQTGTGIDGYLSSNEDVETLVYLFDTLLGEAKDVHGRSLGRKIIALVSEHDQDAREGLRTITAEELMQISGIGPARAGAVLAAIELSKKIFLASPKYLTVVDSPDVAVSVLREDLMWAVQERFAVVLLDVKHQYLGKQVITIGTATETLAHPRDIFRTAIKHGATRILVAHNHPSGSVKPSNEDIALTRQLLEGAEVLGVPLLDHLILGKGSYQSLRQTTTLWSS